MEPPPQGSNGEAGSLRDVPSFGAPWLHPYFVRFIIAHARDAYRNGRLDYAGSVLDDYLSLLKEYGSLNHAFAILFEQQREEIEALLHRITNNLDYFNNAAGWVPLLSLEANMNAFEQEVDAAIHLLYLSLWLQSQASKNIKDVAVLQDGITKLQTDIAAARSAIITAANELPSLQFEATDIEVKLDQLQLAIEAKEAELLARAQSNIEDRYRVPFYKKALRIIGAVSQAVPAFQPALGALGQGLQFVADFDTNQPLNSLRQLPNIYRAFKGTCPPNTHCDIGYGLHQSVWDWKGTIEGINPSNSGSWKEYTQQLHILYKRMEPHFASIRREFGAKQIADDEVRAEFEKLQAESSEFNLLIDQVSQLQAQQQAFLHALADAMHTLTSQSARINENMLAGDALRRNVTSTAGEFDHEMVLYVKDLESRAKERLQKYQYYMAKSYEYRMLQPYPGDFNLDNVVENILGAMNRGYPLSVSDFSSIKGLYIASVREIVAKALEDSQRQSSERQVPLFFELTPTELQRLNQAGSLTLDISSRIAGLPDEENRHISDIAVDEMRVQAVGVNAPVARVRAIIDHRGRSTQTLNGRRYEFHFGNGSSDRPFTWGASYDVLAGRLDAEKPSPAAIFLLKNLLKLPETADPSVLFARPGADRVVLTFRKQTQPISLNAQITRLRLAVNVDFFRRQSTLVTLGVQPSDTQPYVVLDQEDVSGRRDGLGVFERTFLSGQQVTLTAAPRHGRLVFRSWVDEGGNILGTSPTLVVSMNAAVVVRPVYAENTALVDGDFDGNGTPDLVWQSESTRQVGVWYTGGTPGNPAFAGKLIAGPQPGWSIVGVADLNSDGHPDLIWQHDATRAPGVWYMGGSDGSVLMSGKLIAGPQPGWRIVGAADLNRDGHPDLIWQEDATRAPGVWYMGGSDGGTLLGGRMLSGPQPGWSIVSTADLNLDGHPDLMWQEDSTRAVGVWYMGGNDGGTFLGGRMLSGPQPGWRVVGSADFNLDGHPDLIWQQDTTRAPGVWYMGGSDGGTFLDGRMLSGPQPGWRIVAPK